jgi:hypothetical protein
MKKDLGDLLIQRHEDIKSKRSVCAVQRKLMRLSDAEFINWDKALLSCAQPGPFAEDRDFAVLNLAMRNERLRRRDKHNGLFGWRRFLTPADREIWLGYYEKAAEIDSKRPQKDSAIARQVPEGKAGCVMGGCSETETTNRDT